MILTLSTFSLLWSSIVGMLYLLQQQPAVAYIMTTTPSLASAIRTSNSLKYESPSLETSIQASIQMIIKSIESVDTSTAITNNINTMQHYLTYENPIYQIKMQYPADWEKKDQGLGGDNVVKFVLPQQRFPSLFVQTEHLDSSKLLQEFTYDKINHLRQLFLDFDIIEQNLTNLAGNNAYKIVYTFTLEQISYKRMDIWTIKDDRVYIINYLVEKGEYSNYLPTIQKMVDSFEIVK
jgi:serine/threonine-protein kinase